MTNANDRLGLIQQNLIDAGCSTTTTQTFLAALNRGDRVSQQRILQQHRCQLLKTLRQTEQQIDCLDFLANQFYQ